MGRNRRTGSAGVAAGRPILVGARVRLHPVVVADAGELLAIFRDPAVRRYLLDDTLVSSDWVVNEIRASEARFANQSVGLWSIRLQQPAIVGFAGFREFFEPPRLQLLYGLAPGYWRQGLATEAAELACEHAIEHCGLREIAAATDLPNDASARVLRRLGLIELYTTADGPAGTAFYALSREAWLERRRRQGSAGLRTLPGS